jgi:spermidine synthase
MLSIPVNSEFRIANPVSHFMTYYNKLTTKITLVSLLLPMVVLTSSRQVEADLVLIHEEKSMYRNIFVMEHNGLRCLGFQLDFRQSCQYLARDNYLVWDYVKAIFLGLLFVEAPKRILIVGLGGGSIPTAMQEMFPDLIIDVVELDQAVLNVAKEYFNLQLSDQLKVHIGDGRVFINRAVQKNAVYDVVILDAFDESYIPYHLTTVEFFEAVYQVLASDGVLVANTFSNSTFFDRESKTVHAVFGNFLSYVNDTNTRLVIAPKMQETREIVRRRLERLVPKLQLKHISIDDYYAQIVRDPVWVNDAKILTDQLAPVNLLKD